MKEILSKNLKETENFAKSFIEKLLLNDNQATVVALSGNLGSGKTAFVQLMAKLLGIQENLTSPTFVLIKSYKLNAISYKSLFHIDAYRLKSGEELQKLGWEEMIADPKNLIFIEWPENVINAIPKNSINIKFEFVDENTRKIIF